ncbi:PEP-CTERM sorting domain-containing protein [Aquabacterium sp.]|uniref:PEP-CTERM sorting domain-containing protein n=1 Tax=Aquabacterium sp. TaxID=1872578 RepID=UPI0024884F78|nr:PEP-CTERM sorting domain-containing protein [Aquabacterium sp.]MDI1259869.1 PEP-CTERM sorting domain-containing protein [Aquabacterium sp.]
MKKLIASLALCGLASTPAFAANFIGSTSAGASVVTDYSGSGLISFDLDLSDLAPVSLSYQITADDLLSGLDFNAMLRNLTGTGLNEVRFSLSLASFQTLGTVTRSFDPTYTVASSLGGQQALVSFGSPEYLDVAIGNPLGVNGAQDWAIDTGNLQVGDVLTVTAAVPEPESYVMALLGLAALGAFARRRKA